ncbi:MAG: hypothetical protein JXD21_07650 [Candidatus Omnitrophica bacterium]|nr:hypothetical protein [Candidatus Omnitrophota bacterium]
MKRPLLIAFIICAQVLPCYPQDQGETQANVQAHAHASEHSVFNRVGDWWATIGKSGEAKTKILQEREVARALHRAEKELKKTHKEAAKKRKQAREKIKKNQGYNNR